MLLGVVIFIYTDHKKTIFATLKCHCILHWHLYVKEYCSTILYHPCKKNDIVNTFLWLPHCDVLPIPVGKNSPVVLLEFTSKGFSISNDLDLLKCFLNLLLPDFAANNLVYLEWIHPQQNIGTELATKAAKLPTQYFNILIDDHVTVCHVLQNKDHLKQWKIALTKEMVLYVKSGFVPFWLIQATKSQG